MGNKDACWRMDGERSAVVSNDDQSTTVIDTGVQFGRRIVGADQKAGGYERVIHHTVSLLRSDQLRYDPFEAGRVLHETRATGIRSELSGPPPVAVEARCDLFGEGVLPERIRHIHEVEVSFNPMNLMLAAEVAEFSQVAIRTIYSWRKKGHLRGFLSGRRWLFGPDDVARLLAQNREQDFNDLLCRLEAWRRTRGESSPR